MLHVLSLTTGIVAWVLGCLAVASKTSRKSHGLSAASFSSCVIALISQLLEIGRLAAKGDFSSIEDTIRAVIFAAIVLTVVTAVLNVVAFIRKK